MIQNSTERFTNRVENYVKYRPGYPKEFIDYLYTKLLLSKTSIIADIGSGTGILSSLILERGSRVVGIEPNKKMRIAAEKILEEYPKFVSIDGTAENTGLEDNSVDYIICAQSFHWFDKDACKEEFQRILKPCGKVILVWNDRIVEEKGFSADYEELLRTYAEDYNRVNNKLVNENDFQTFFKEGVFNKVVFSIDQKFDFKGLKGRLLSSSYAPMVGDINHEPLMDELVRLFDKYEIEGKISFRYETKGYIGEV